MEHVVTIGGKPVTLVWNQDLARRYAYRAGCIGGAPSSRELTSQKTSTAAFTKMLWLLLPPAVHATYASPEDLAADLDHEAHASEIFGAVAGIVGEMNPSSEKKSTSGTSHSQGSNSD